MIKKKDFLKEYNIEKETLKKTGMKWEELNSIYDSYCRLEPQLKKIGKDFVNDYLYDIEKAGIMRNPHNARQGSGSRKHPGPQPRSTSSSAFAERSGSSTCAIFSCIRCR